MKITKQQLKQIIKEEFQTAIDEKMGLPDNVPVEAGSTEDHKRRCKAAGVSNENLAKCMVNPEPFEKEKERLDNIAYDRSADEQDKLRSSWLESKQHSLKQMIKEEIEQALTEFGYGGDPYAGYGYEDIPEPSPELKAKRAKERAEKEKAEKAKADLDAKCKDVRNRVTQLNFEYTGGGGTRQTQGYGNPELEQEINDLMAGNPDCFGKELKEAGRAVADIGEIIDESHK